MTGPAGEMPFLDHLEELRQRLVKALVALSVGFGIGLWAVERFQLVALLKAPIEPYLPSGRLTVLSPTEPVMIVFKLGFLVGGVLASPVVLYQVWAFLAPALYDKERKVLLPSLTAGAGLFALGAAVAYRVVLPKSLEVLFSFQSSALSPMITYDAYFDFVLQVVLALGISFELPLVMILLAVVGLVTPRLLNSFRRYAIVLAFAAGAVLSPGTDVISMVMFTIPLLLLYEVGVAGATVVARRKARAARAALVALVALALGAPAARAQQPVPPPPRPTQQAPPRPDSTGARPAPARGDSAAQRADTARVPPSPAAPVDTTARAMLPKAPTRKLADADSAMKSLLERSGYTTVRFRADSATILVPEKRLQLVGEALTVRDQATLEADSIAYDEPACLLRARGEPRLFEKQNVVVGEGIRYDTCKQRGVLERALTTFQQGSATWFIRGDVAQDSSTTRIFAGDGEITSCDLPTPHYTFRAHEIKWVSNKMLAARPITLYVRDVPVAWFPFIWQDMRPGRHSGILPFDVGVSDIVRLSSGYQRKVTNVGYYWAASDYWDLKVSLDWFSRQYVRLSASVPYNVLNRFMGGTATVSRTFQANGGSNFELNWNHRQQFGASSSLTFDLGFASSSSIVVSNSFDPLRSTQNIRSSAQYQRRFAWGSLNLGATRSQALNDGSVALGFPSLTISPSPQQLTRAITWSPSFSLTRNTNDQFLSVPLLGGSGTDSLRLGTTTTTTQVSAGTPFRIGNFQVPLSLSFSDQGTVNRTVVTSRIANVASPGDSLAVQAVGAGTFNSSFDWNTSIALPILFQRSWKLTPSLLIANRTSGAYAVRNALTGGNWVTQGKRFGFGASASPTFFAFLPGILPGTVRLRHQVNPLISWTYQPASDIPLDYARAITPVGATPILQSPASHSVTVSLNQTLEGKRPPEKGDSLGLAKRNFRILSIQTSPITYDFEQAKLPGRTGWGSNASMNNTIQTDLIPGFGVNISHSLFIGDPGSDTSTFSPYLTSVSSNFTLTGRTFRSLLSLVGLASPPPRLGGPEVLPQIIGQRPMSPNPSAFTAGAPQGYQLPGAGPMGGQPFAVTVAYTLSRTRPARYAPTDTVTRIAPPSLQSAAISTSFNPTPFWSLTYQGQYNVTAGRFESHSVQLRRALHEWQLALSFQQAPGGNVLFTLSFHLTDLPRVGYDYRDNATLR